jgi:hypothetical protein
LRAPPGPRGNRNPAGGADDREIDLEPFDEPDGGFADQAAIRAPQHAAGDNDLAVGICRQSVGYIDIVGDHEDVAVVQKRARHRFGGGADIDEQRRIVRDGRGAEPADPVLLVGQHAPARLVAKIGEPGFQYRAAMHPGQEALVA